MGLPFLPSPLGLRRLLLAGCILSGSYQMPPPAVTQPGCYSASLLLAAAFCFLDFSLGVLFCSPPPKSVMLALSQGRVFLTVLASAYAGSGVVLWVRLKAENGQTLGLVIWALGTWSPSEKIQAPPQSHHWFSQILQFLGYLPIQNHQPSQLHCDPRIQHALDVIE